MKTKSKTWKPKSQLFCDYKAITSCFKVKFTRDFRSSSKHWVIKQDARFVAMVTKDLQTLNLKFGKVMFNSLILIQVGKKFRSDVCYFQCIPNKCSFKLFRYVLKLVMIENVKIAIIQALKSKFYRYFGLTKKTTPQICLILHQFNFYVFFTCGKNIGND